VCGCIDRGIRCEGTGVACVASWWQVRLWDARTGEKIGKLRGHTGNVRCCALRPDAGMLLSGSTDGTIKLWDLGSQRCIQVWWAVREG
jgi:WD repeat-containing protein 48